MGGIKKQTNLNNINYPQDYCRLSQRTYKEVLLIFKLYSSNKTCLNINLKIYQCRIKTLVLPFFIYLLL